MSTLPDGRPRNWRDHASLPLFFVAFLVIWSGGQWLMKGARGWPSLSLIVGGVVFALFMTVAFGVGRRRLHTRGMSIADSIQISRSLRRGRLPEDPVQRAAAPARIRQMRWMAWVIVISYPLIFGSMFGLTIWQLAAGDHGAKYILFAVFFGVMLVAGMVFGIRWILRAGQVDRLLAADRGAPAASTGWPSQ
jgi:hypothetical protein